jgi:hypothetical protein
MLELRGQLDDEMPWEFGFPQHLAHAYPEALPPEEEHPGGEHAGDHHGGAHDTTTHDVGHGHDAALAAGAHATGARHLTTTGTGHGPAHGRTPGGALGHGRGRTTGGPGAHAGDHDTQFDWQHRESTDHEVVEALFGGGLFGGLLGLAVGADTDETRADAERSTPQLHERRQAKERELRHRALQTKHNEHVRNDDPAAAVTLSHAEIIAIREQLDQEMPLQYVTPQYVDQHDDARMTADGTFGPAATLAADDDPHGGAEHHDDAHPAGGEAGAGAGAPGATPATDTTTGAPTQDTDTGSAPAGDAAGGAQGPGLVRTGLAAAAGAVIGHQLAEHFDHGQHEGAHDDSYALDEEHAGRIFAAASEVDIDNLSRRLWSRIRREMRTELLVDRERAGSLADIR